MSKQSAVLERQENASSNKHKLSSNAQGKHLTSNRPISTKVKLFERDAILEDALINNHTTNTKPLTRREAQILQLIVSGRTNREIARILYRTERTIEYNRSRLMRKLGAHNAAELVKRAITMGIVS